MEIENLQKELSQSRAVSPSKMNTAVTVSKTAYNFTAAEPEVSDCFNFTAGDAQNYSIVKEEVSSAAPPQRHVEPEVTTKVQRTRTVNEEAPAYIPYHVSPKKSSATKVQKKTISSGQSGYMGVTYDMLSNYEINNIVVQEQRKTTEAKAPRAVSNSYIKTISSSPARSTTSLLYGKNKFANPDLEAATAAIQAEFDNILASGVGVKVRAASPRKITSDNNLEGFYQVMGEFAANDNLRRHASPTMRLIQQKNSTWEHK